jgi:hypothetical protein
MPFRAAFPSNLATRYLSSGRVTSNRHFPSPWSLEEANAACFAAHGIYHAAELDDASIAGALDHATVVYGDGGIDQIAAERP